MSAASLFHFANQKITQIVCRTVLTVLVLTCLTHKDLIRAQDSKGDDAAKEATPAEDPFPKAVQVPEGIFDGGAEWLNTSQPISMKDLKGKIVLVDFWTYCCINCMHVLPDLAYLEEKYGNQLVVIGVHSAKFDNEKDSANIRNAIMRYEIKHPVVNDNEMLIWRKFGTRAWPTLALIDAEGRYIGSQGGEGNRELFDNVIGRLVEYHRAKGTLDETPLAFELEAGNATPTPLRYPGKVTADTSGNRLFITDSNHNRIVVTSLTGELLEIIGSGRQGTNDGEFATAEFNRPQGTALVDDQLYVADTENHLLRVIDLTTKSVKTIAGTGTQGHPGQAVGESPLQTPLNSPWSLAWAKGNLYIAMAGPHQVWVYRPASSQIAQYAGSGREDVINGSLTESAFAQPSEIVADASGEFLYLVDSEGSAIRRVPTDPSGIVTTIAGTSELPRGQSLFAFGDVDGTGDEARFQHPLGIAIHGQTLLVADSYNHKIRKVDLRTQAVTSWIGSGQPGKSLDPPLLDEPGGLAISHGQIFIADTNNHRICVADLDAGTMNEFVIEGLTAPSPPTVRHSIDSIDAITIDRQSVKPSARLSINVALNTPDDYKLNTLAPVIWRITSNEDQSIIAPEALNARDEATLNGTTAMVVVPLTENPGEASITLQVSYGYCSSNSSLCRLASQVWIIPIEVNEESEATSIELSFPKPNLRGE